MEESTQTHKVSRLGRIVVLTVLGVFVYCWWPLFIPFGPSLAAERRTQRQTVNERVEAAGGWAVLQRDCDALAEQYRDSRLMWYRQMKATNVLPPALIALKPQEVLYDSPAILREFKDQPLVSVIHIKIFGLHSTGGHSTPYCGLEVVCSPNPDGYSPPPAQAASGNGYTSYNRVTDRIYEVY